MLSAGPLEPLGALDENSMPPFTFCIAVSSSSLLFFCPVTLGIGLNTLCWYQDCKLTVEERMGTQILQWVQILTQPLANYVGLGKTEFLYASVSPSIKWG